MLFQFFFAFRLISVNFLRQKLLKIEKKSFGLKPNHSKWCDSWNVLQISDVSQETGISNEFDLLNGTVPIEIECEPHQLCDCVCWEKEEEAAV